MLTQEWSSGTGSLGEQMWSYTETNRTASISVSNFVKLPTKPIFDSLMTMKRAVPGVAIPEQVPWESSGDLILILIKHSKFDTDNFMELPTKALFDPLRTIL